MRLKFVVILVMLVLLSDLALAFEYSNHSIDKVYGAGDSIRGWLNISFQNENINSIISSNFPGTIELIDLLDKSSANYTCNPLDCSNGYISTGGATSKSFSLSYGQEKLISFFINENIQQIISLSFNISVTNPSYCTNPLKIDLLDDGSIDWKSNKVGNDFSCPYGNGTGCFNVSEQLVEGEIGNQIYCEKIKLMASEKFRLGAWVRNGTTHWSSGLLKMSLYDLDSNEIDYCDLPSPSDAGGEISCEINYSNEDAQDYYVCLKSEDDVDYKIKKEDVNPCGFYGEPPGSTDKHDYYIFARAGKFSSIGNIVLNQDEYEKQGNVNLADDIENYILNKYANCSAGCSIPIKLKSYGDLNINIYGISLRYTSGGITRTSDKIYNASIQQAKLSSNIVELNLDSANITVPSTIGNRTFFLYLDNNTIFSDNIRIENVPVIKNIFPKIVPAAKLTTFTLNVSAPSNRSIVEYRWDFGDGWENTTQNKITHTYIEIGDYELKVEVEDSLGYKSSKIFGISAVSPKENVNSTIRTYKGRLSNITSKIALMPSWYKDKIENLLVLDDLTSEIQALEQKYSSATSDDEYVEIMTDLNELEVPIVIKESSLGTLPFFVDVDDIKPSYFADFGAGSLEGSEESYKDAIAAWSQGSLDLELEFKYISAYYDDKVENLLSVFNLDIKPKENLDKEIYVIIEDTDIIFSGQQNTKDFTDAVGVKFPNIEERNLEFAISGDVPVNELVLYLSPEFSQIELGENVSCNINGVCEQGENSKNCPQDCRPWGWMTVLLIILFFAAIVAYIFMQWWYKEKYESYLFKNRNDLYNLMNFISNARSQGLQDKDIASRLKQSGWSGEQISYVFKKMAGKAIMPFDFLKLFKKIDKIKLKSPQQAGKPVYATRNVIQKNF